MALYAPKKQRQRLACILHVLVYSQEHYKSAV